MGTPLLSGGESSRLSFQDNPLSLIQHSPYNGEKSLLQSSNWLVGFIEWYFLKQPSIFGPLALHQQCTFPCLVFVKVGTHQEPLAMTTATATKTSIKHRKTTTLHMHITRFGTFIANYCTPTVVQCKIPSSTFHGGCKHNRMSHLDLVSKNSVPGKFTYI